MWERHEHTKTRFQFSETKGIALRRFKILNEVGWINVTQKSAELQPFRWDSDYLDLTSSWTWLEGEEPTDVPDIFGGVYFFQPPPAPRFRIYSTLSLIHISILIAIWFFSLFHSYPGRKHKPFSYAFLAKYTPTDNLLMAQTLLKNLV